MAHNTKALVAELQKSGLTQREFCIKKKIPISTQAYHIKKSGNPTGKHPFKPAPFIPLHLDARDDGHANMIIICQGKFSAEDIGRIYRSLNA